MRAHDDTTEAHSAPGVFLWNGELYYSRRFDPHAEAIAEADAMCTTLLS